MLETADVKCQTLQLWEEGKLAHVACVMRGPNWRSCLPKEAVMDLEEAAVS